MVLAQEFDTEQAPLRVEVEYDVDRLVILGQGHGSLCHRFPWPDLRQVQVGKTVVVVPRQARFERSASASEHPREGSAGYPLLKRTAD